MSGGVVSGEWSKEPITAHHSPLTTHHSPLTPKITDFGLAKQLDDAAAQTQTGAVLGTPSYMAPEQAAGRIKEVGPAADVYALGAILYECLTGRPPFRAPPCSTRCSRCVTVEPVPPRRLQPKVPRDLETICLKCLHKETGQALPVGPALADDLHRFLAGEPITARPVGRMERGWSWCRRNPAVASLLASVIFGWQRSGRGVPSPRSGRRTTPRRHARKPKK